MAATGDEIGDRLGDEETETRPPEARRGVLFRLNRLAGR